MKSMKDFFSSLFGRQPGLGGDKTPGIRADREDRAALWRNKGAHLAALGRNEEAIRCFDHALGIDPLSPMAWITKGNSLAALGRHEEAICCYDRVMETV